MPRQVLVDAGNVSHNGVTCNDVTLAKLAKVYKIGSKEKFCR